MLAHLPRRPAFPALPAPPRVQAFGFLVLFVLFLLQAVLYDTLVSSAMGAFQVSSGYLPLCLVSRYWICCWVQYMLEQAAVLSPQLLPAWEVAGIQRLMKSWGACCHIL